MRMLSIISFTNHTLEHKEELFPAFQVFYLNKDESVMS